MYMYSMFRWNMDLAAPRVEVSLRRNQSEIGQEAAESAVVKMVVAWTVVEVASTAVAVASTAVAVHCCRRRLRLIHLLVRLVRKVAAARVGAVLSGPETMGEARPGPGTVVAAWAVATAAVVEVVAVVRVAVGTARRLRTRRRPHCQGRNSRAGSCGA